MTTLQYTRHERIMLKSDTRTQIPALRVEEAAGQVRHRRGRRRDIPGG